MTQETTGGSKQQVQNGDIISSDHSIKSKKDEQLADPDVIVPPDGGWGWMVVFGSFVIHVIADGVYYSFGVFIVALIEDFEVGRGEAGWVGSILIGTLLSVGPIASIMTNTLGCRMVVGIGTITAFCGFVLSIFAPNIYFLYFSIGIIGGTGLGLAYLPAIVCISYYFEKKRSFATGIAVCGSGIGTFIFAPLSQLLLDEYGWQGALLIESALLLNCAVAGLLFRPLEAPRKPRQPVAEEKQKLTIDVNMETPAGDDGKLMLPTRVNILKGMQLSPTRLNALKSESGALSSSMHMLPTSGAASLSSTHNKLHKSDLHLNTPTGSGESGSSKPHPAHHPSHQRIRKDAFYTASLENIPMYKEHRDEYRQSVMALHKQHSQTTDAVVEKETTTTTTKAEKSCLSGICSEENIAELKDSMDLSLFKDVLFQMFAWSNFLTNFAFFVPYMFLPDRAILLDIDKNYASSLVSIIGISNTIGRLIFGFLADRECINRLMLYNTAVTAGGLVTIASALAYNFWWLSAYAIVYGLVIGVYVTLTPIIIVDLLGIEKLSNAFGLVMFFQGIATLLGPPIAGWFYDSTGSYMWPFVLFGIMLAISGIMLYPIPCVRRCIQRREGVTQHDVDMGKKVVSMEYIAVSQNPEQQVNTDA